LKKYATEAERLAARRETNRRHQRNRNKADKAAYMRQWRAKNLDWLIPKERAYERAHPGRGAAHRRKRLECVAGRPCPDVCEVCGNPPGKKRLAYDHSHQTGAFRGWLCANCNVALGMVRDDINHLRKLIAYLQRGKNAEPAQRHLPGI
jgi:hypothetical protein